MTHNFRPWMPRAAVASLSPLAAALALALTTFVVPMVVSAQNVERSGKEVVAASCVSCHGTGANGAPKIGDKKAWAARAAKGLTGLTSNALQGIRQMPPHGGNPNLTDTEIERAITYMVNQSGGHWIEPVSRTAKTPERTGEQIVKARCIECHETGKGGAPKIGDQAAWIPRMKQGLDVVVRSAINGHGAMPARGGQANLTDAEMRSAVAYMFAKGGAPAAASANAPQAAAPARSDGMRKVIGGTSIDLGIVTAESIRAEHPKGDAESSMHGGIPEGKAYFHVNVSLHDAATSAAIDDAEVEVTIMGPVTGRETKKLEPMAIRGTVSYGNYFRMPGRDSYTITVQVRRTGAPRDLEAKFAFKPG